MLTLCFGIAKLTVPQVVNGVQHKNKEAKMKKKSKREYMDGFREIREYVQSSVSNLRQLKKLAEELRYLKYYNSRFDGATICAAHEALDTNNFILMDELVAEGFDFSIYANSDEMFI
jgi:hypothetical protein